MYSCLDVVEVHARICDHTTKSCLVLFLFVLFFSFQEILDKEGEAFEVIPDTQFSVARTANKDNSSHYEVDGKRRVFKDVAKLLRKKGIDLDHNRFLILQGEVEQIAMMKPIGQNENDTGMLEFLEDIVGSSRFKVGLLKYFDMSYYNLMRILAFFLHI